VLKLRGTFKQHRSRREPRPDAALPRCPEWLDEQAKEAWGQVLPQLRQMKVLSRIDENALARYCQYWSRWRKAEDFIAKHGSVYPLKDEQGRTKCLQQFPQVAIAHKLGALLTRLEAEFGMTPSSRSRIQTGRPDESEEDPMAEFLRHAS
jgi:P27 family predicted phage terminase small subunit